MPMKKQRLQKIISYICVTVLLSGCVNQHPANIAQSSEENRIVATSAATLKVCDMLSLPLIARPKTAAEVPEKYQELPEIGSAMGPDVELIKSLRPTNILGPDTLRDVIEPKYEAAKLPYLFLNLRSVQGLYDSMALLGEMYDRQEQATQEIQKYHNVLKKLEAARGEQSSPTVLLLMGFPGSYCQATASSYIGNLVELAGGVNIVTTTEDDFVSYNTEELIQMNPDYILWTSHAMPEMVEEMFQKEFETNDVWKHFDAVKEGRVVQLDCKIFHMSANFRWPEALTFLYETFYNIDVANDGVME